MTMTIRLRSIADHFRHWHRYQRATGSCQLEYWAQAFGGVLRSIPLDVEVRPVTSADPVFGSMLLVRSASLGNVHASVPENRQRRQAQSNLDIPWN